MSSIVNFDALNSMPADILESHNLVEAELQAIESFFDIERFGNDFGLENEDIAVFNDALPDYSMGAFELGIDAPLDAYSHVPLDLPYDASGSVGTDSVTPGYSAPEDLLPAPPTPPSYYGDAYGVYNQVTHEWRGQPGQQTIYVHPPPFVQPQGFQVEAPRAQNESVWEPGLIEPQAWQAPEPDLNFWQGSLAQQRSIDEPPLLVLQQDAQVIQEVAAVAAASVAQHQLVREPELVEPQETAMQPPTRACKRKARQSDEERWPKKQRQMQCVIEDPRPSHPHTHSTSSPIPTSSPSSLPSCSSPSSAPPPLSSTAVVLSPDDLSQLKPIVVEPPNGFHCPMPGCGVPLPGNDAAWRGHFWRIHHKDLCADARTGSCTGKCKWVCPLPKEDGDAHKCAMPMLVDSIGRHFLNIHFGLCHQCPLCGKVEAQRLSACKRHIPVCWAQKVGKQNAEAPAKEERKKPAKMRGRKTDN
ncbi:hypothetical protein C8Q73DRAFT_786083 [Cubamyces lactineus]|nr:hypothetical protein C8Q73DRAFT_786083 [Cubamyces lactineus]